MSGKHTKEFTQEALCLTVQVRDPDCLRLVIALSALYATGSEEKRLLDAVLLAVPQ